MTPIRRTAIKNKYISLMVVGTHLAIFPNAPGAIFSWSSEAYLFVSSTISPTSSSVKNSLKHWTSVADAGGVCIPDFELSKKSAEKRTKVRSHLSPLRGKAREGEESPDAPAREKRVKARSDLMDATLSPIRTSGIRILLLDDWLN